jgi:ABC-2 type transport system permease protein
MTASMPARRAAEPRTRALAQVRFEAITLLRNGEQLLVSLILPTMAMLALTFSPLPDLGDGSRIDVVAPGVLALAVASTAFTGQAISTAFDRRYGVLRMYGVSPLGRSGLLLGKAGAVLLVLLVQCVVLGALAVGLGWRPELGGVLPALIGGLLGVLAFIGLALLMAGTLRAEAVLAVANLLWVVFLGAGLLIPVAVLPSAVEPVAALLPSGALGESLRASLIDGAWPWGHWAVLAGWGVVTWVLGLTFFRWAP